MKILVFLRHEKEDNHLNLYMFVLVAVSFALQSARTYG